MAHTGSFVPADTAIIGVTDRIFTRIGAHDNLRQAQSTFMVEMLETAHILHNATERSLVVLDEVGRGTSPEDGFALAWAIGETLAHDDKGLVLFATHFHDLQDIADTHSQVFNSHLSVSADNNDLIFLRKVTDGATNESFGLVVAEKAGIPKSIVERAKQLALDPPNKEKVGIRKSQTNQLALLPPPSSPSRIESEIKEVDINSLTPLEALQLLAELKKKLE
jgi:DNA mismatch repair protein MutS